MSRILTALGDQDVLIETNGRLHAGKKRWHWMGSPGEVKWEEWMSTLVPLDRSSPLRSPTPEPRTEEELDVSHPSITGVVSDKAAREESEATAEVDQEEEKVEAEVGGAGIRAVGSEVAK